jgi:nitrite reductase/ring-hydroxylating ferredoxin subunit
LQEGEQHWRAVDQRGHQHQRELAGICGLDGDRRLGLHLGGSQGIIVYRNGPDQFTAMDRHCTYQPENLCKVYVDDSQVIARDTVCCGSAFLLLDGSVTEGPAALGLKLYHTTFNGTTLHIFN